MGAGMTGMGGFLWRSPAGAGRDHPKPPAPDAPVARALSQSLPEGERFRDALPHGHLCVSPLRGERAPTRGAPTEGIDSRVRENDGYGRVLQRAPEGEGRDHPQATRPRRAWTACPLSVSPRGREVWGCPLPRSPWSRDSSASFFLRPGGGRFVPRLGFYAGVRGITRGPPTGGPLGLRSLSAVPPLSRGPLALPFDG